MAFTDISAFIPPEQFGLELGGSKTAEIPGFNLFTSLTVPASGNITTTIQTMDYAVLSVGATAASSITVTAQPYLDIEATIPASAAATASGTTAVATTTTGTVFRSASITISNAGSSPVALTGAVAVMRGMQ